MAKRGKPGVAGKRGPRGIPGLSRADVLAIVEDQFAVIRHELAVQLKRTAQIQVQLDQVARAIKKLVK